MQELCFLYTLEELNIVATKLLKFAEEQKIFLFKGEMGVGKTTLIKKLCASLSVNTSLSSPTYSIVNEYPIPNTTARIYHMDLYRLQNLEEALAIGIEEYLFSGNYCFIEWPEFILPIIKSEVITINLEAIDESSRKISIFRN